MRRFASLALVLAACAATPKHIAVDNAVLGRVIVYRNGVAFYARTAKVYDGRISVRVPRDRVDDFLKSLTVADPYTRKPIAVSIPRKEADDGSYLTMTLETSEPYTEVLLTYVTEAPAWKPSYRVVIGEGDKVMLEGWAIVDNVSGEDWNGVRVGVGASSALSFRYDLWSVRHIDRDLLHGEDRFAVAPPAGMSPYVEAAGTEELVTLGADEVRSGEQGVSFSGKTPMENVYIVEGINTSSKGGNTPDSGVTGTVTDKQTGERLAGVTVIATGKAAKETLTAITDENGNFVIHAPPGKYDLSYFYDDVEYKRKGVSVTANQMTSVRQQLENGVSYGETIAIRDSAPAIDPTSTKQGILITHDYVRNTPVPGRTFRDALGSAQEGDYGGVSFSAPPSPAPIQQGDAKLQAIVKRVLDSKKDVVIETRGTNLADAQQRGQAAKNKLVDDGIPAAKIHIVPKVGPHEPATLRVLAVAPVPREDTTAPPTAAVRAEIPDTPVGESHFESERPMNVRAGTSAMVAMLHGETTGGVVYLYDPISDRGDERFAFKAVRLDNPTDDTLEPGPVTVYGDNRFIGEGITEAVPPKASVVVPFALDRQILVSRNTRESDRIAKLVTVQRGIVTAEIQHRREARFTVTSRLTRPTKVYLRHRLESGWHLVEQPSSFMTVGDSQLFEVELGPGETKYVTIAEATPMQRSLSLDSAEALDLMKVFIEEPDASPALKQQVTALLATHTAAADLVDRIKTLRDQLAEYRARAGELHAQIVTLKAVKTSGALMTQLRSRLAEMSARSQKTTLAIVDAQEKLMLKRLELQNQLADLRLTDTVASH